ncbi:hypothetical protein BD779DRAFT_1677002 [Infundibulicybe gibba]|nr:hypothetical protein BD779DRAFT_1677002 [Infundibulicybe gibba]
MADVYVQSVFHIIPTCNCISSPSLLFDCVVLVITIIYTSNLDREIIPYSGTSILRVVRHDGIIYFASFSGQCGLAASFDLRQPGSEVYEYATQHDLTSIMLAHIIISLRSALAADARAPSARGYGLMDQAARATILDLVDVSHLSWAAFFQNVADVHIDLQLAHQLQAAKWYFAASCTLFMYDYILTIREEIVSIWAGSKNTVFYLFLLNRYFPMAFIIITLFAYSSPAWTFEVRCLPSPKVAKADAVVHKRCKCQPFSPRLLGLMFRDSGATRCDRFAIVEWIQALVISYTAEIMLAKRIYALTSKNRIIACFLGCIIVAQCTVVFYAIAQPSANRALHVPSFSLEPFHICILYSNPTLYLALSISFDCTVFAVTAIMTFGVGHWIIPYSDSSIIWTIWHDGMMYFCAILTGNIVWMIFSIYGGPGLKLINAQPSMMFTSIMVTRLTLSLKATLAGASSWSTFSAGPDRLGRSIRFEVDRSISLHEL